MAAVLAITEAGGRVSPALYPKLWGMHWPNSDPAAAPWFHGAQTHCPGPSLGEGSQGPSGGRGRLRASRLCPRGAGRCVWPREGGSLPPAPLMASR